MRKKVIAALIIVLGLAILIPILSVLIYPIWRMPGAKVLDVFGVAALRPCKPSELTFIPFSETGTEAWKNPQRLSYSKYFPVGTTGVPARITAMRHPSIDARYVIGVVDTTSASLGSAAGGYIPSGSDVIYLYIGTPLTDMQGGVLVTPAHLYTKCIRLNGDEVTAFLREGLRDSDVEKLKKIADDAAK